MRWLTSDEVIWLLGAILGVGSIFAAMYLDNKSFLIAGDYKAVLPSITFIAASSSRVSVAEAFNMAQRLASQSSDDRAISARNTLIVVDILLALWFLVLFAKDASKASNAAYAVDSYDVFLSLGKVVGDHK